MPTAWPSTAVVGDYAADKPATQTTSRALWSRQLGLMRCPFELYFTEATRVNNGAYGTLYSFSLFVPAWVYGATVDGGTLNLAVNLYSKLTGGASGTWRVRDTSGNSGTDVVVTSGTYAVTGPSTLAYDSTMVNATRSLVIEGLTSAGATLYVKGVDLVYSYFTD